MAGGPFATAVLCLTCPGRAERVGEGQETDWYVCSRCGRKFGVDWSDGPPQAPTWPPTAAQLAAARRFWPATSGDAPLE